MGVTASAPSLAKLSEILGVSPATVSRVLNDRPGIGEETRRRVMEAVRIHGTPRLKKRHDEARENKEKEMKVIGFVVSHELKNSIEDGSRFYLRHLLSIQKAAADVGFYAVMVDMEHDFDEVTCSLRCIERGQVQGVIAERVPEDLLASISQKVPTVVMNGPSYLPRVDSVIPNVRHAARLQLDFLHSIGHRKIACFRHGESWQEEVFWSEYRSYGATLGLHLPPAYLEPSIFGHNEHAQAIRQFMDSLFRGGDRPTAVVTYDPYAIAIREECLRRGIRIPEELSILGFDDNLPDKLHQTFPLTSYRQNFEEMGREAIRLLLDRIQYPHLSARGMEISGSLIIRDSTRELARQAPPSALPTTVNEGV